MPDELRERLIGWLLIHYFAVYLTWLTQFPLLPQGQSDGGLVLLHCLPSFTQCRCFLYGLSLLIWWGLVQALGVRPQHPCSSRYSLLALCLSSLLLVLQKPTLWQPGLLPLCIFSLLVCTPRLKPVALANFLRVFVLCQTWQLVGLGWGKGKWLASAAPLPPGAALLGEQLWLWTTCLACLHWNRIGLSAVMVAWTLLHSSLGLDCPLSAGLYLGLIFLLPPPTPQPLWPWLWLPIHLWLNQTPGLAWLVSPEWLPESQVSQLQLNLQRGPYQMRIICDQPQARKWTWYTNSQVEIDIWRGTKLLKRQVNLRGPIYFEDKLVYNTQQIQLLPNPLWACPEIHSNWCQRMQQLGVQAKFSLKRHP